MDIRLTQPWVPGGIMNDAPRQLWSLMCPQTRHWPSWPQLSHLSQMRKEASL